ncbi:MAG: hypothetical protein JRF61_14110 [Deltaproteobacteria bacterium]|nr:hypothetical protein [Deltaproteobacteria bacterium]
MTIAVALVLSASAMRIIGGLPAAFNSARRYWVHLSLVAWELLKLAGFFWTFWRYREAEWIFPTFLLLLASTGITYFNACALVSEDSPSVESWDDDCYSVRTRYFVGVGCWTISVAALASVVQSMPLMHPVRSIQLSMVVLAILGATSSSRQLHSVIALFVLALTAVSSVTVALNPDPLGAR